MATLQVELVAVERKIWSGEARMVIARTTEGELGVMPGHAPLLGQLAEPSEVRIKTGGGDVQDLVDHMRDMESSGRIDMGAFEGEENMDDNEEKYGAERNPDPALPSDGD